MTEGDGLLEAIEIAMEAEMKARDFYNGSIEKVKSFRGRDLLTQLAKFEQNHYERLGELKKSLADAGEFVDYAGMEFDVCGGGCESEAGGELEGGKDEIIDILNLAIEAESKAHERYLIMAGMTDDPKGQAMFKRFANEELLHRRILSDEFYHISNKGLWVWSE